MQVLAELRYEKVKQIGIGEGMNSEVYLSNDLQVGGQVAVKEIPKASFGNVVSKYFEESQAMFRVAHSNVVPIQYGCQTGDHIVLAMPYFKNGSLTKRIAVDPLSLDQVLRVGQGVLSGLAQIHLCQYLHLDIRPSNVLFNSSFHPLLADFGQSRRIDDAGTVKAPELYYTAMPPETLRYGVATVASDIYQVGLLLYRCLNGEEIYSQQLAGKTTNAIYKEIEAGKLPDLTKILPHAPKRLRSVIRRALSVDPTERFQSATDMADALAAICVGLNWEVAIGSNETTWTARRESPELVVRLSRQDWNAKWSVAVYTKGADGKERAKSRGLYWRESLSRIDADKHLKNIFCELR